VPALQTNAVDAKLPQLSTICFQWHCPSSQDGSLKISCSFAPTQTVGGIPQSVTTEHVFAGGPTRVRHFPPPHVTPSGHAARA
jgi:hypothetical protein